MGLSVRLRKIRCELEKIAESQKYAAPEIHIAWWHRAAELLGEVFSEDHSKLNDWQEQAIKIWMGEVTI